MAEGNMVRLTGLWKNKTKAGGWRVFFKRGGSMNKQLLVTVLAVALAFTGCGMAAKVRARDDMGASKAAYKRCLEQNSDDPSKCEALRRAYEADLKAYMSIPDGIIP